MIRPIFAASGLTLCAVLGMRVLGYGASAPLPPAQQPLEAYSRVLRGAAELDLAPAWDSLPSSWQADLDLLVDKLEDGANPDLWARSFSLMERFDVFLRNEYNIIVGSERLAVLTGAPVDVSEEERNDYLDGLRCRLASILTTVTTSGLEDPDNLKHLDLREQAEVFLPSVEEDFQTQDGHEDEGFLNAAFVASLIAQADELDARSEDQLPYVDGLEFVQIKSTRSTDGVPAWSHNTFFTHFEERWCDASMVRGWDDMITSATTRVDAWTQNSKSGDLDFALDLLAALEEGMTGLEEAATAADLDASLDLVTGKIGALILREKIRAMMR